MDYVLNIQVYALLLLELVGHIIINNYGICDFQ